MVCSFCFLSFFLEVTVESGVSYLLPSTISFFRPTANLHALLLEATGLLTGAGPYLRRAFAKPNYQLLLNCYQPNTTALHCALPTLSGVTPTSMRHDDGGAVKLPVSLVNFKVRACIAINISIFLSQYSTNPAMINPCLISQFLFYLSLPFGVRKCRNLCAPPRKFIGDTICTFLIVYLYLSG